MAGSDIHQAIAARLSEQKPPRRRGRAVGAHDDTGLFGADAATWSQLTPLVQDVAAQVSDANDAPMLETVRSGHVVIGVDTHKHIHVAAVMDSVGGILTTLTISTDTAGFTRLLEWAASFGKIIAFGIEGTGSYGAALTSFARRHGHKVIEVSRPDRRLRRLNGKSDTLDAENTARAVLAGFATAIPKTADGVVEMIRQLKVAHDTAVKDRTGAMITLKAMLVHASEDLRRDTAKKTQKTADVPQGQAERPGAGTKMPPEVGKQAEKV